MRIDVTPQPRFRAYAGHEDEVLIALVRDGDEQALGALYDRYGRTCYGLASRVLAGEQFAQDVVQEVFLAVWRDAVRFDGSRGRFSTWLMSMTHHKAVDAVRREEALRRRTTLEQPNLHEAGEPQVHDEVWLQLRRERVRAALAGLPEAQRQALALAYFGGYTQREIAGLTSTPLGTVKTRMLTGMRRLRATLEGLSDASAGEEGR